MTELATVRSGVVAAGAQRGLVVREVVERLQTRILNISTAENGGRPPFDPSDRFNAFANGSRIKPRAACATRSTSGVGRCLHHDEIRIRQRQPGSEGRELEFDAKTVKVDCRNLDRKFRLFPVRSIR